MSLPRRSARMKAVPNPPSPQDLNGSDDSNFDPTESDASDNGSAYEMEDGDEPWEPGSSETTRPPKRKRTEDPGTGRTTTTRGVASNSRSSGRREGPCITEPNTALGPNTIPRAPQTSVVPSAAPDRRDPNHPPSYHRPLLLSSLSARQSLLSWFDSVSTARAMPWRKAWIDPSAHPSSSSDVRQALEMRAYEVWISEIMLQQTRVATVIGYWDRWMARWPTIHDLAAASEDDVLSLWRGLGYYSRATRIHAAARTVCAVEGGMGGLLPADVALLQNKIPGVGRYTAGAICAIVFGQAVPMVDGNVLRVLSRQLGLFGDVKADKVVVDTIWKAADALVRQVARDGAGVEEQEQEKTGQRNLPLSDRPGRWGQALMELGSTVCTPKPDCSRCPITSTCRAYNEGYAIAFEVRDAVAVNNNNKPGAASTLPDIEDLCAICDPLDEDIYELLHDIESNTEAEKTSRKKKAKTTDTTSSFFTPPPNFNGQLTPRAYSIITSHARKFPPKSSKTKPPAQQESQVCAIRRASDGRYLLQRRPAKGLLANLWELPSHTFPARPDTGTARNPPPNHQPRQRKGIMAVRPEQAMGLDILSQSELIVAPKKRTTRAVNDHGSWMFGCQPIVKYKGELGIVPWTFSHIKMTMYVQVYEYKDDVERTWRGEKLVWALAGKRQKWATVEEIDAESMGTGMRKCWELVKETEC